MIQQTDNEIEGNQEDHCEGGRDSHQIRFKTETCNWGGGVNIRPIVYFGEISEFGCNLCLDFLGGGGGTELKIVDWNWGSEAGK